MWAASGRALLIWVSVMRQMRDSVIGTRRVTRPSCMRASSTRSRPSVLTSGMRKLSVSGSMAPPACNSASTTSVAPTGSVASR